MKQNKALQFRQMRRREIWWAYLLLAPVLILFATFVLIPLISTFVLTTFEWNMLTPPKFIGLENFTRMFSDERLRTIIGNTLVFAVAAVVLKLTLGLAVAFLVWKIRTKLLSSVLEAVFFFPIILPMAIVATVWGMLLNTDMGVVNGLLVMLGFDRIPWMTSADWSLRTVILLDTWKGLGFFFIIFLVALRNVPRDIYEAADMDGASEARKFFSITLPFISPTTLFLTINAVIGSLQVFDQAYILTKGGPGDSSATMVFYIWQNAFGMSDMGYGATMAVLLFAFIMLVTLVQFVLSKKWVFYN